MDTTRRQLLAAIPAVGIGAGGLIMGQEQPVLERTQWDYRFAELNAWTLETRREGITELSDDRLQEALLLAPGFFEEFGAQGWSIVSHRIGSMMFRYETVIFLLKRPFDKRKRVVWEFKSFKPILDEERSPFRQFRALGKEGWEIFYATPLPYGLIHAQRPKKEV